MPFPEFAGRNVDDVFIFDIDSIAQGRVFDISLGTIDKAVLRGSPGNHPKTLKMGNNEFRLGHLDEGVSRA